MKNLRYRDRTSTGASNPMYKAGACCERQIEISSSLTHFPVCFYPLWLPCNWSYLVTHSIYYNGSKFVHTRRWWHHRPASEESWHSGLRPTQKLIVKSILSSTTRVLSEIMGTSTEDNGQAEKLTIDNVEYVEVAKLARKGRSKNRSSIWKIGVELKKVDDKSKWWLCLACKEKKILQSSMPLRQQEHFAILKRHTR